MRAVMLTDTLLGFSSSEYSRGQKGPGQLGLAHIISCKNKTRGVFYKI